MTVSDVAECLLVKKNFLVQQKRKNCPKQNNTVLQGTINLYKSHLDVVQNGFNNQHLGCHEIC